MYIGKSNLGLGLGLGSGSGLVLGLGLGLGLGSGLGLARANTSRDRITDANPRKTELTTRDWGFSLFGCWSCLLTYQLTSPNRAQSYPLVVSSLSFSVTSHQIPLNGSLTCRFFCDSNYVSHW